MNNTVRLSEIIKAAKRCKSSIYDDIKEGTFPPGFPTGPKSVAWFEYESEVVTAAKAAGQTKEQLQVLVISIIEKRKEVFKEIYKKYINPEDRGFDDAA